MRTSDPAAYDQFVNLAAYTSTSSTFGPFRALLVTHTTTGACTFNIQQIVNGSLTTAKSITINLPTNAGGTFLLPLSGETVYVTGLVGTAYALV